MNNLLTWVTAFILMFALYPAQGQEVTYLVNGKESNYYDPTQSDQDVLAVHVYVSPALQKCKELTFQVYLESKGGKILGNKKVSGVHFTQQFPKGKCGFVIFRDEPRKGSQKFSDFLGLRPEELMGNLENSVKVGLRILSKDKSGIEKTWNCVRRKKKEETKMDARYYSVIASLLTENPDEKPYLLRIRQTDRWRGVRAERLKQYKKDRKKLRYS
ncbi:MAG: hypothetical protein HUJ25_00350 [Crocinitomicaceae bacterium]|nr:hypothetical protein [Crocinitomicaceae bacterium]